jgi:urease accessory protein UreF
MENPNDPLDSLLDRWGRVAPEPSDRLESETWRRLAHAAATSAPERRAGWFTGIEAMFARPSFTVAFVAACILLGLFLAESRVSHLQEARSRQVVQNYLRLIDPLVEPEPAAAGVAGGVSRP